MLVFRCSSASCENIPPDFITKDAIIPPDFITKGTIIPPDFIIIPAQTFVLGAEKHNFAIPKVISHVCKTCNNSVVLCLADVLL